MWQRHLCPVILCILTAVQGGVTPFFSVSGCSHQFLLFLWIVHMQRCFFVLLLHETLPLFNSIKTNLFGYT
uniref:Putative secreted protein n=1 Tax=Amblyomma triste TaxID=251400 RepID=A0A023G0X0_AMBTT